jgi:hypothetical protein
MQLSDFFSFSDRRAALRGFSFFFWARSGARRILSGWDTDLTPPR